MNLALIIGFLVAYGMTMFGIMWDGASFQFGAVMNFVDIPSILITFGGTIGVIIMSFPFSYLSKIPAHFKIIMGSQKFDPLYYINVMTDLSQEARKKGLLALEDSVNDFEDPFLRDSIMLIVDAMEPDKVKEQIENEMNNIENRHATAWDIYDKGAALGPGFGMIGTLIGLVNMLKAMDFEEEGGATKLAMNMAVALITTFYGSMLSNALFIPLATQLRLAHEKEMLCKDIILEGIISIQAGENPRHINEKLLSFLTQKQRESAAEVAA